MDELIRSLGLEGVSKSEVSRICAELDATVERFRNRRLQGPHPYLWLDAAYIMVRENGRVLGVAGGPQDHSPCGARKGSDEGSSLRSGISPRLPCSSWQPVLPQHLIHLIVAGR